MTVFSKSSGRKFDPTGLRDIEIPGPDAYVTHTSLLNEDTHKHFGFLEKSFNDLLIIESNPLLVIPS